MTNNEGFGDNTQLQNGFPHLWKWSQNIHQKAKSDKSRIFREESRTNSALMSCLGKDGIQSLLADTQLHRDLEHSFNDLAKRLAKDGKRPTPRIKMLRLWDAALELHALRSSDTAEFAASVRRLGGQITRLSDLFQSTVPEIRILRELALGCCNVAGEPKLDIDAPFRALKAIENLELDPQDVFIARNLILGTYELSSEETMKTLGVTRQTIWNRKRSIVSRFDSLRSDEAITKLVEFATTFQRHPVRVINSEPEFVLDSWDICYDRNDTLVAFLTEVSSGTFPSFYDLLHVVFYLTTYPDVGPFADMDAPPVGLQCGLGPGWSWDEGNGRYITARYVETETESE